MIKTINILALPVPTMERPLAFAQTLTNVPLVPGCTMTLKDEDRVTQRYEKNDDDKLLFEVLQIERRGDIYDLTVEIGQDPEESVITYVRINLPEHRTTKPYEE